MFEHDSFAHALLGVFYACVLYFCVCACSLQLCMFHMKRPSRNMFIVIMIIIVPVAGAAGWTGRVPH